MTAQEFLSQYGEPKDNAIHFVKSGNTVVVPLSDLLYGYLGANLPVAGSAPAKERTVTKKGIPKKK